ncbi:hypothetical protein PR048_022744 [Dryococelus australis]|uniref:Uncharacterized protein n=1 Tax=Dryococelus australis TaxID=614101 RepID=A0ABQ9GS30_9NEOP|nr:hypothetical protein PR048_022744 [Dryococelus australis]
MYLALENPITVAAMAACMDSKSPNPLLSHMKTGKKDSDIQLTLVAQIPSVGPKKAADLLRSFGHIRNIAAQSKDSLARVVGKTTAVRVWDYFREGNAVFSHVGGSVNEKVHVVANCISHCLHLAACRSQETQCTTSDRDHSTPSTTTRQKGGYQTVDARARASPVGVCVLVAVMNANAVPNPPIFSVICDTTRGITGEEQPSVSFRWVDKYLCPHESFVGLYSVGANIEPLFFQVSRERLQLPISNLRGQPYDEATNVSGKSNGVQEKLTNHQSIALYVHCGAHCVNLVSLHDKTSLVHLYSCERGPVGNIEKFKPLCPTRWIYRGNQMNEIIEHYKEIPDTYEDLKSHDKRAGLLRVFDASSKVLGVVMAKDEILKLEVHNRSLQGTKNQLQD